MVILMGNRGFSSIVIVVVILLLAVGGYLIYQNKFSGVRLSPLQVESVSPQPNSNEDYGDWLGYYNYDRNFKIRYPKDWTKNQLDNKTIAVYFTKDDFWEVNVMAYYLTDMKDPTLDQVFNLFLEPIRKWPDYRQVAVRDTRLSGLVAKELIATATFEKQVKIKTVMTLKDGSVYIVSYRVNQDKFDEMLPTADRMIESFEILR